VWWTVRSPFDLYCAGWQQAMAVFIKISACLLRHMVKCTISHHCSIGGATFTPYSMAYIFLCSAFCVNGCRSVWRVIGFKGRSRIRRNPLHECLTGCLLNVLFITMYNVSWRGGLGVYVVCLNWLVIHAACMGVPVPTCISAEHECVPLLLYF